MIYQILSTTIKNKVSYWASLDNPGYFFSLDKTLILACFANKQLTVI